MCICSSAPRKMWGLFLAVLVQATSVYALDCYECNGIQTVAECHTVIECPVDNICSTQITRIHNETDIVMGCKPTQQCQLHSTTQVPTITTDIQSISSEATLCSSCCSKPACNALLCSAVSHGTGHCVDDIVFDCAYVSTTFDICSDIAHAKAVCKKFCGLCDLVDGGWADWAAWSACDTTCGNGTVIRTRTCTNPVPVHGGSDCPGPIKQTGSCQLSDCPVHGGWSIWSPWGSCSKTCGIGLQRRDRSCSNPYPARFGDHCFGDDKVYRACFEKTCVDGAWSSWASWGACSASCDRGLRTRTRTCNNPQPSQFGRDCPGNNMDYQLCNTLNCPGAP